MTQDPNDTAITTCAIAAMAENRAIGRGNALIWHIPEDLKHFKRLTMGKPLIMGRKTFESLPGILPGRPHIIVSRAGTSVPAPASAVKSIEDGITKAQELARAAGQNEIFIAGGADIYRQALPLVQRLYLTIIHRDYEADAFFPAFAQQDWRTVSEERHEGDPAFTFYVLERL